MDGLDTARERRREAGATQLIARYDTAGFTHPALLDGAVETMLSIVARNPSLHDGMQVRYGWSVLTLRQTSEGLLLCEPHFESEAPLHTLLEQVTVTAQLTVMQQHFNARTGTVCNPCLFLETVTMLDGVLDVPQVLLVHGERLSQGHSGWALLPRDGELVEQLHAIGAVERQVPSYMLMSTRPHLLKALGLPPRSIVGFHGDAIEFVRDGENVDVLREAPPEHEPTWYVVEETVEEAPQQTGWLGRLFGA